MGSRVRFRSFIVCAGVICAVLAAAPAAIAAPAAWESVDVVVHPEQQGSVMMVAGTLPESTPLPAEVVLSVPSGTKLSWAGEIMGGDGSDDPTVEYKMTTEDGWDLYTFTLTKSRVGQIEAAAANVVAFDGKSYAAQLTWRAPLAVPKVTLSVGIPQNATVTSETAGGALAPGSNGIQFYQRVGSLKKGESLSMGFAFTAPSAQAGQPVQPVKPQGSSSAIPIVLSAVALGMGAMLVVGVRRKLRVRSRFASDDVPDGADTIEAGSRVDSDDANFENTQVDSTDIATPAPARKRKALLVTSAIITVVVVGGVAAAAKVTSVQQAPGGIYTQEFQQGEACSKVTLALTLPGGQSADAIAQTTLDAAKAAGAMSASVDMTTKRVQVAFCESATSPQAIAQALAQRGISAAPVVE